MENNFSRNIIFILALLSQTLVVAQHTVSGCKTVTGAMGVGYPSFMVTATGSFVNSGTVYFNGVTTLTNNGGMSEQAENTCSADYRSPCISTPGTSGTNIFDNSVMSTTVNGTNPVRMYAVSIDRSIQLDNEWQIVGTFTFASGMVMTDRTDPGHFLHFLGSSSVNGNGSNSHVDGYAAWSGTGPFTLPVGNGTKEMPVGLVGDCSSVFKAAYFSVNPGLAVLPAGAPFDPSGKPAGTTVSQKEYWDINGATATPVTLHFDADSDLDMLASNLSQLVVMGWDGTAWVSLGQSASTGTLAGGGTVTCSAIVPDNYLAFTLGAQSGSTTCSTSITLAENSGKVSDDGTVCSGAGVTLTAASGGTSYVWNTSVSTASITVMPASGTSYTVTVTDAANCTATASVTVAVDALPTPVIAATESFGTANNDGIICVGNSVTLGTSGGTYLWSSSETSASIMVSPTATTTYTVTVTDANKCSATATRAVTVNALPAPTVTVIESTGINSNDGVICQNGLITLSTSGGNFYLWSSAQTTATISVNLTASTSYTVTVTDVNNCSATATRSVTVTPVFSPVVSVQETSGGTPNDGLICAGSVVNITVSGGSKYLWEDGSTSATRQLTPACPGSYQITTTDSYSCTLTSTFSIQVGYPPELNQVSPLSGTSGTLINIYGSNLTYLSSVRLNGQTGQNLTVINPGQATVIMPFTGAVQQIELISPCGSTSTAINAPTISSISPSEGNAGTIVTLSGTNLGQLVSASIGGTPAVLLSQSATTAKIIVMPGTASGPVSVSTAAVTTTSATGFTVNSTPYPYFQQGVKVTNAAASSGQGTSVSMSSDGNTAIVGGPGDNSGTGAAWIYIKSGSAWVQQAKLIGTGAVGAARQGISVAISSDGNTAVVGGSADNSNTGAVWVFVRNGSSWVQQGPKLVGTGAIGASQQGTAVAISGDGNTIASGGVADDGFAGAAWLFVRYNGLWAQSGGKYVGTGAIGKARQGASLALSEDGSRLLSGGYQDNNRLGAAWIFYQSGGCNGSSQVAKLVGTGGTSQAWQGYSVSLSADGNTAVVGGINDNILAGAAWLYTYNGGSWVQQARLVGTNAAGAARQGSSVSLSADGNTILVSGMTDDANKGALWVYKKTGSVWLQQGAKMKGTNAIGAARQGTSVSLSRNGSTAIIGGPADNANRGAFWVFIPGAQLQTDDSGDRQASEEETATGEFRLEQNIPNPTVGGTVIPFSLPESCVAEWEITDVSGRVVILMRREYPAGPNSESFDMSRYSGMYYYRLKTPFGCLSRNMLIAR